MKKSALLALLLSILSNTGLHAHGIHVKPVFASPSVIVYSGYSDTQPAAGALVRVFSPADQAKPFQTGTTDIYGKFAFVPYAAGEWIFSVDDQMGHAEKASVTVRAEFVDRTIESPVVMKEAAPSVAGTANLETAPEHEHEHEMPLAYKLITALSLIFGITGVYYGIKSGNQQSK
ncbi:MAG: hypothetical protein MUE32_08420 [Bacteroidales bacterium]|jgi:hypothetical protein|nr:hypothetical protein [Bacteroidales bacterium]